MNRAAKPSDRRDFGRRDSRIHAIARLPGRPSEPCVVRNYSDGGALVEFPIDFEPPPSFRLVIEAKGIDALCEVRHKKGTHIGVRFLEEGSGDTFITRAEALTLFEPEPAEELPPVMRHDEVRLTRPFSRVPGDEVRRLMFGAAT